MLDEILITMISQQFLEILNNAARQKIKRFISDDIILHLENVKNFNSKLLYLLREIETSGVGPEIFAQVPSSQMTLTLLLSMSYFD